MKQKLAVISAWIHNPSLLLWMNFLVGLDPKATHLLKEMMKEACDEAAPYSFQPMLEVAENQRQGCSYKERQTHTLGKYGRGKRR